MSDSTLTDIVEYVMHNIQCLDGPNDGIGGVFCHGYCEDEFQEDEFEIDEKDLCGWTYLAEVNVGKRNRLFGLSWTKNGHVVTAINTSPYMAGGAVDFTLVASNRAPLEAFMKDFEDICSEAIIVHIDSVSQTN